MLHVTTVLINVVISKVPSQIAELGEYNTISTETIIKHCLDFDMFPQAKRLVEMTGVVPNNIQESWKINLVKKCPILITPLCSNEKSLVHMLHEKSFVDSNMVYKLIHGELLRRDDFEKMVHYPWKHAIFKLFLAYRYALTHLLSMRFYAGMIGIVDDYCSPTFGEFAPFNTCFPMHMPMVYDIPTMIVLQEEEFSHHERKKQKNLNLHDK